MQIVVEPPESIMAKAVNNNKSLLSLFHFLAPRSYNYFFSITKEIPRSLSGLQSNSPSTCSQRNPGIEHKETHFFKDYISSPDDDDQGSLIVFINF